MAQGRRVFRPRFPGLIAPASLKLDELDPTMHYTGTFSGVNRPGLIEARCTMVNIQSRLSFSGVNRPGLIEAEARARASDSSKPGFPGLIAPASLKLSGAGFRVGLAIVFRG